MARKPSASTLAHSYIPHTRSWGALPPAAAASSRLPAAAGPPGFAPDRLTKTATFSVYNRSRLRTRSGLALVAVSIFLIFLSIRFSTSQKHRPPEPRTANHESPITSQQFLSNQPLTRSAVGDLISSKIFSASRHSPQAFSTCPSFLIYNPQVDQSVAFPALVAGLSLDRQRLLVVPDRLLHLPKPIIRSPQVAEAQDRPFQEYFYYYIMERFLYRMAQSPYANKIVLKGALIFQGWGLPLRLPTIFHCVRSDNELRAWLISILNQQS